MYYLVYGFLWLLSLFPWKVLYILSDGIYVLVFYVFKYRRTVVMDNLRMAFPEKSEKEIKHIAKRFYHNLIDTFIETIKMFSSSKRSLLERMVSNWDSVNTYYKTGRNVQILIGHNFNWELCTAVCPLKFEFPFIGVYMPMTNKIFEKIFCKLRSRYGTLLVRATHMREEYAQYKGKQHLLALGADQNPGNPANAWWFNFFGRPTPFVKGPAKGAISNNIIVVFAFIHKIRRGFYEIVFELLTDNPAAFTEEELTGKFVHNLEAVIRKYPDMWLWSHRRWKHKWKAEYGPVIQ